MASLTFKERAVTWLSQRLQSRVPYSSRNPYLEGMYAPVTQERTETKLRVTGELPRELNGLYARIGPNPMQVPNPGAYHWFTGDGMVHGVRLQDGQALWYRNRWIGSDSVRQKQGRSKLPGPRRGVGDAVNTNVFAHGGRIWAAVEAGSYPVELNAELDTIRHGLFDSQASHAFTAHPRVDPATGEAHAICYDALKPKRVTHMVVNEQCQVTKVVELPVKHGPMIHDCAITRTQVIVLDLPVTFSLKHVFQGAGLPYGWNERHEARVGLLPRHGQAQDIRWIPVDPCYVFHTCNAHDLDDGGVMLDVVVHARMFDRSRIGPEADGTRITFERWHIDPARSAVKRTVVSDRNQEFPRCNETLSTLPYRYAYTVGFNNAEAARGLLRHDLHTGSTLVHDHGAGRSTGEAVFVPREGATAEDDGWLLSYVYDANTDLSDLVVVNAQDLAGPPQAVVHLPVRVPAGFHGNWLPNQV
ncbi:carotenoid oxygenase family protein [Aquabacterium sp.]|uniref:carotenoid oxygenase family protein n=1 Tax=Aquabacterium sp. TaxID=1872578 RepID=UPI003D6DA1F9